MRAGAAGQAPVRENVTAPKMRAAMIEVNINGQVAWALVDSGADRSMINDAFAQTLLGKTHRSPSSVGKITGAGGEPLVVTGEAEVPFRVQAVQFLEPMTLVQGLVYAVVLGRDFCCKHSTVLDDEVGVLRLGKQEIRLPTYAEIGPKRARVMTCQTLILPPRSEVIVRVSVQPLDGNRDINNHQPWQGVLEPVISSGTQEWMVPRVVAVVADETMPVKIVNLRTEETTVPTNTDLGTFYTIQEDGQGLYEVFDQNDTVTQTTRESATEEVIKQLNIEQAAVSETGKRALKRLVGKYRDIFSKSDSDIGRTPLLKHRIATGEAKPIRQRPRRIPLKLREEVENQKNKMLRDGIIEESSSPWCSPIVLAKKKDGKFRFCVDLRAVNSVTQSLPHPLPRVDDALDSLAGARYFTTLDMASGYWQVELEDEDREKTAFSTGKGLHHFRTMAFGLKNAGPTFQRLMELVLAGVDPKSCLVYIDDIIIFEKTEQAHLKTLEEVFQKIKESGMKLKPTKCSIAREEVVFLGHKVGRKGIQPDPANAARVREWLPTTRPGDLKSFLGLSGYYSRFIPGYSDLVKPLREAADRKEPLTWSEEMKESFEELKTKLTSQPILALPTFQGTFTLATDASNTAVGSVLTETVEGEERVIAYASRVLNKTERRWPTYDKELWAVVWSIRHFRQYLVGTSFKVLTDHKPLLNLPHSIVVENDATGRRGRWAVELSSYDFSVSYRKGENNGNADAMSRPAIEMLEEVEQDQDYEEGKATTEACLATSAEDQDLQLGKLAAEQEYDVLLSEVKGWVVKGKVPPKKHLKKMNRRLRSLARCYDQLIINNGVLGIKRSHNGKEGVRILLPRVYQAHILKMLHDDPMVGHLGHFRTRDKVLERFFWPNAEQDIQVYCDSCVECQRRKRPTPHMQAELRTETQSRPYERIAIDITEMPMSTKGNKYALVAMDYFSKYVHVFPMSNQTTETVADCLMKLVLEQGVPERLHSDQGKQFESAVFQELCKRLGIQKTRTTPYHPQSDGMVERFNRTLKDMVAKYIRLDGSDWDEVIGATVFAYNTSKHSTTGYTPFFLAHGREARLPVDSLTERPQEMVTVNSYVENHLRHLYLAFDKARENKSAAAEEMVRRNARTKREVAYQPGQKVWVSDPAASAGGKRKLGMPYKGPGTVVKSIGIEGHEVVYKVRMTDGKESNVHHNRLKPYVERQEKQEQRTEERAESKTQGDPEEPERSKSKNLTQRPTNELEVDGRKTFRDLMLWWEREQPEDKGGCRPYRTRFGRTIRPTSRYQAGMPSGR